METPYTGDRDDQDHNVRDNVDCTSADQDSVVVDAMSAFHDNLFFPNAFRRDDDDNRKSV